MEHALAFARLAKVKHLVPFHYDPEHDDDMLDAFFDASMRGHERFTILPAREGATFSVSEHARA